MVNKSALMAMINEVFDEHEVGEHDLRQGLVDRFSIDFAEVYDDDDPIEDEEEV